MFLGLPATTEDEPALAGATVLQFPTLKKEYLVTVTTSGHATHLGPGVHHQKVRFSGEVLKGYEWPTIEIVGENPGPRIAVWAGMHVNEISSIEAALRLAETLEPEKVHGRVSILPMLNLPALHERSKLTCPIDGKNINFCFPGSPSGTFSEALAYALLEEWASDAVCTFDMHGGDVSEDVDHYTMIQLTEDNEFNATLRETADAFGGDVRVELPPKYLDMPGRSMTARSKQRKLAVFSEAGNNARLSEADVAFHLQGVLGVAAKLGVLDDEIIGKPSAVPPSTILSEVLVVKSTVHGWGTSLKQPGDHVAEGEPLVSVRDMATGNVSDIRSPHTGRVMWIDHHPSLEPGQAIAGIGL